MKFEELKKYICWIIVLLFSFSIDFIINLQLNTSYILRQSIIIFSWGLIFLIFYFYNAKNNLIQCQRIYFDRYFINFILFFIAIYFFLLFMRNGIFNIFSIARWKNVKLNVICEYEFFLYKYKSEKQFYFQVVYYLLESVIVTCLIALFQELGEKIINKQLPWGAMGICLTWGLIHIFSQGIIDGIFIMVIAFLLGLAYKLCNKNLLFVYLLLLNVFFL